MNDTVEAIETVALGDNTILHDVAMVHEPLVEVRHAVANALAIASPGAPPTVFAVSMMSVGRGVEDQLIVFSPGGDNVRNARELRKRLRAAVEQVDKLLESGAFDG